MKNPKLNLELLKKIFTSASIRRWNDQATPVELTELDKQAHKIVIAYFLAHFEKIKNNAEIDFKRLILQFCYEFFERIVLTDIKPPVFHELTKNHNKELVDFVCTELESALKPFGFLDDMRKYLYGDCNNLEKEILKASHYYASKWEFDIIYHFNPNLYGVKAIKTNIDKEVHIHYHLCGIQEILYGNLGELVNMFGQLRFQKRWSRTPRVPQTSVLGHTLIVALSAFLLGFDFDFNDEMQVNHFFGGLFHDLPEILTRDIISPVKKNVLGLDELIKKIEGQQVEDKILKILPDSIKKEIKYYTQKEFDNRYIQDNTTITSDKKGDEFLSEIKEIKDSIKSPIFGEFLKYCDHLSAFLEAKISITHGIKSKELIEGANDLEKQYKEKTLQNIAICNLFIDFKE
ncbi:MAG: HD domain-containing protein [Helicobacteraceae bacterium]|nr:HD domain-containing protein [Helicobacteraceae bacterium]